MEAKRSSMPRFAPSPMLIMAMTAPTPMMMPRAVRKDLILFRPRARKAIRKVLPTCLSVRLIMMPSPSRAFLSASRGFLADDQAVLEIDPLAGPGGDVGL